MASQLRVSAFLLPTPSLLSPMNAITQHRTRCFPDDRISTPLWVKSLNPIEVWGTLRCRRPRRPEVGQFEILTSILRNHAGSEGAHSRRNVPCKRHDCGGPERATRSCHHRASVCWRASILSRQAEAYRAASLLSQLIRYPRSQHRRLLCGVMMV
jgi:hypothetical protein